MIHRQNAAALSGGVAVVGRADDQHGAVARQVVDVVVERAEGDVEAALGALLGEPGGDRLGGAEVRAEQHAQRGAVPGDVRHGGRCRCGTAVGASAAAAGAARSRCTPGRGLDLDVEVVGLDGERGLGRAAGSRRWSTKSNRCSSMPSTSVASCRANCRPMQARWPVPNGL